MTNYGFSIANTKAVHLSPGDKMVSLNRRLTLNFQDDGNLVLSHVDDGIIWAANCHNQGGCSFNIQEDGNAVVYDKDGKDIWRTGTYIHDESLWGQNWFVLENNGNLVMYHNSMKVWTSNTSKYPEKTVFGHEIDNPTAVHWLCGDKMVSMNGKLTLEFQHDGNLVLTHVNAGIIWAANCHGQGGNSFNIQRDGNAVVYNNKGPIWQTGTYRKDESLWHQSRFVLQDDGNLVMYLKDEPVWASSTSEYLQDPGTDPEKTLGSFKWKTFHGYISSVKSPSGCDCGDGLTCLEFDASKEKAAIFWLTPDGIKNERGEVIRPKIFIVNSVEKHIDVHMNVAIYSDELHLDSNGGKYTLEFFSVESRIYFTNLKFLQ